MILKREGLSKFIIRKGESVVEEALTRRVLFEDEADVDTGDFIVACRDRLAGEIVEACVTKEDETKQPVSERIDSWVLNRALAPFFCWQQSTSFMNFPLFRDIS